MCIRDRIGGVLWFGVDDANMAVFTPVYCCATKAPVCYTRVDVYKRQIMMYMLFTSSPVQSTSIKREIKQPLAEKMTVRNVLGLSLIHIF